MKKHFKLLSAGAKKIPALAKKHLKKQTKTSGEKFPLGLDFFSLFVHDLKAPLMSLKFHLDHLKLLPHTKEFKDTAVSMEKDIARLFRFIHDALEMKEIENKVLLNLSWHSWDKTLNSAAGKFEKWLFNSQIELKVSSPGPLEVEMAPRWIDSAVSNLLANAIEHSPRGSKIQLSTKQLKNGGIIFSIKDEGSGIKEEMKDKIFHRFQTCRISNNSVMRGSGLGLFIAQSIIEGHNGKIGVLNSGKKGCVFYFTLPKARRMGLRKAS